MRAARAPDAVSDGHDPGPRRRWRNFTSSWRADVQRRCDSSTAQASATYSWSWGDATSGTGQDHSHTYGAGGTYSVTLSVTDAGGTSTRRSQ